MDTASDQNAGLTPVKGGRKQRWAGSLRLWYSSEKITARLVGAPEQRGPGRGVPQQTATPNYYLPVCSILDGEQRRESAGINSALGPEG